MKRILSLDGGGIRGVFSLAILQRVEAIFRQQRGRPDLVLRDEFDFFAGTSTGGIIAAFLAWGLSIGEILTLYRERGAEMFAPASWWHQRFWRSKYRPEVIAEFFQKFFVEADGTESRLGTKRFFHQGQLKYLLMVMRNATTGSAWPVSNNPSAMFNAVADSTSNLNIPLWQLLRASSAAPTFFPPQEIDLGSGKPDLFVDGGLTPYNNPALIAALMATLPPYRIGWTARANELLVLSVGTGHVRAQLTKAASDLHKLDYANYVAPALISSVGLEQDMVCRVLGRCLHGAEIDMEIGNLHGPGLLSEAEKKFTYVRYDRRFSAKETAAFEKRTGRQFTLDNLSLIPDLVEFGEAYANDNVRPEHFGFQPTAPAK